MPIQHFSPADGPEPVAKALGEDGCAVVDGVIDREEIERFQLEMAPHFEATSPGPDRFTGFRTKRTGGLAARSATARDWIVHPLVLGTVEQVLAGATSFHVHLTQVIAIGPGEPSQPVHRDQWAFDFFPFPNGYEVQCNTIWALTDFTEENGATRVIPGSHRAEDRLEFKESDTVPAEMSAGSVLFYTGAIYHGGGANRSDAVRMGANITYARSWLRQEENQYLTVPPAVARDLPEPLLKLLGYSRGAYALGYVDDLRDPMDVVRGSRTQSGFGELKAIPKRPEHDGLGSPD